MPGPLTKLVLAPPRFPSLFPNLPVYVMLPGYDRRGPISLREGFEITRELPPGRYRLTSQIPPNVDVKIDFELHPESTATIRLAASLSLSQRLKVDTKAELAVVFILKETRHVAHFWLGHCENNERLGALLSEAEYWKLDDEERKVSHLSEFAKSQNERWYDHDFLEAGWEAEGSTLSQRFHKYSWSEIWAGELDRRAKELKLRDPNCFIMLGGSPDKPEDWDLNAPGDIGRSGIELRYMGKIEFSFF